MFDFVNVTESFGCQFSLADMTTGLVAGTKVATPIGWRAVEGITKGDQVLTFDGGMQEVVDVRREVIWTGDDQSRPEHWPLHVPAGALGNRGDMMLMAGQSVMVESDTAERLYGDPFAMIPALALEGYRGITRTAPAARIEILQLVFAQDEVVFANIGALFLCPAQGDLLDAREEVYPVMALDAADDLVAALEMEETGQLARAVA